MISCCTSPWVRLASQSLRIATTVTSGGGGVASLFGDGGFCGSILITGGNGASGGGAGAGQGANAYISGGNGFLGTGGHYNTVAATLGCLPKTGLESGFSIDFIGTGGGGVYTHAGVNGGGGGGAAGGTALGGFPGGGGGNVSAGGDGLVIVEW